MTIWLLMMAFKRLEDPKEKSNQTIKMRIQTQSKRIQMTIHLTALIKTTVTLREVIAISIQ